MLLQEIPMRWASTDASYEQSETSFLAILETVLAVCVTIWIAIELGSLWNIAFWSLVGWALLLRTEASMMRGAKWFVWYYLRSYYLFVTFCQYNPRSQILTSSLLAVKIVVPFFFSL
jgi:hypothetical protein